MSLLLEKIVGHTAVISMNNPPANTWTAQSLQELKAKVLKLNGNKEVYALVITGEGEKFFSAGADLKLFADGDKNNAADMARYFGEAFETLSAFRGVSIAAINGYAMGGGLEVALACDLRICEEQAQMALPEATVGLLPCAGGTQNLTALVGEGWTKRMILCGERIKATKAEAIGLVEEVVATGDSFNAAMRLAEKVANQSPSSVAACKRLVQAGRTMPRAEALPLERSEFADLFDTQDQTEGVSAFLNKRKAVWKNG
ncbi:Enoyl-CoA hydratase/isomerase [Shewanella piezotolerans WP3]|uniref:Enoyl-CoA hydratase/isomerase n=1 Tax=Shewanella piezotolerans (strain WP3 / JCM 13877) TaxID=225849 RepID=B8CRS7_SHEPW|nr:enoyl-CoA hydratase [Shewanella piezotolerans]ACJ30085.1 Enoyl-CoA hydratase/isomerase [Shewanella piezotolerans WP3]